MVGASSAACDFGPPHTSHPCPSKKPEAPGAPCRFCSAPVPLDGSPCPACWIPVSTNHADAKALLALGGFDITQEATS